MSCDSVRGQNPLCQHFVVVILERKTLPLEFSEMQPSASGTE